MWYVHQFVEHNSDKHRATHTKMRLRVDKEDISHGTQYHRTAIHPNTYPRLMLQHRNILEITQRAKAEVTNCRAFVKVFDDFSSTVRRARTSTFYFFIPSLPGVFPPHIICWDVNSFFFLMSGKVLWCRKMPVFSMETFFHAISEFVAGSRLGSQWQMA